MPWRGPYEVVQRLRGQYSVATWSPTGKLHQFSEHLLDVYNAELLVDNPRKGALSEQQKYDIAEVLEIREDPRRKNFGTLH